MVSIIRPPRGRKYPDPYIAPVHGTRGPCALCKQYSQLTENHVPPEGVGNSDRWIAQSYMTTVAAKPDMYFGRHFPGGIRFRTLCKACNSSLGGSEDKALIDFYERVRRLLDSPLQIPGTMQIPAKPNLIVRGLMAHIASANDSGIPTPFDGEARDIFLGKRSLRLSSWNLYYWIYLGEEMFLMRSAFLGKWHPLELTEIQLLKAPPLAFMFARKSRFYGLPNMVQFVQNRDDAEIDVPIILNRRDQNPVWPAVAERDQIIFLGGPGANAILQGYDDGLAANSLS